MGYLLRSARGREKGLGIPIGSRIFLIGSSPKSQIRSRKPGIGRRHCAFVSRKKKLFLQDLRSGQPTQVNGLTLTPGSKLQLKTGDRVRMGPMEFVIEERRKKSRIPVAAPYAPPPVPMGKPASVMTSRPAVVPVTSALAAPVATVPELGGSRPVTGAWSLVLLGVLAVVGLGAGVGLSRAFLGRGSNAERDEDRDNKIAQVDPPQVKAADPNPRESRVEPKRETPKQEVKPEKPVEVKPAPEVKKPPEETKPPEAKKPPVEEPKKEEPKKPDPPMIPMKPPTEQPKNRLAFASDVLPVLKERCIDCHGGNKKKGGLDLTTIEAMLKGGDSGVAIVAGDPDKSPLYMRVDDGSMPPAGKPLTPAQKKILQDWIIGAKVGGFAR
jgi:hypothetical protein